MSSPETTTAGSSVDGDGTTERSGLAPRVKLHHGLTLRDVRVVAVEHLTASMVRVTLGGDALAGLVSLGPTDHVKAFFPDPVTGELTVPVLVDGVLQRPSTGQVHVRDYTARAYRPEGAAGPELDLDLVLHGDRGPASRWASAAVAGDRLVIAGPKGSKLVPDGVRHAVLGCDETALPAVARWLELLPPDVSVQVLAEVGDVAYQRYLDDAAAGRDAGLAITWLNRSGAPGTGGLLEQAVRAGGPLPSTAFLWFAGEAGSLVGVRRYLRRELRLPPTQVEVTGYWRRGDADFDHHAPLDPSDPD